MPRRLKLSPLQRDITWMLEEAGAERIDAMIATLKPSNEAEFFRNIDGLVELGLVREEESASAGRKENKLVLTERGRKALTE